MHPFKRVKRAIELPGGQLVRRARPDEVEQDVPDIPASAATPTVRPWTADFLLPSISFCEPKRP
jgi:hypothetical protein